MFSLAESTCKHRSLQEWKKNIRTHEARGKNLSMEETERCQVDFAEKQLRCCEKTVLVWVGAVVHTLVCQHTWRWAASGGLKDWRQGSGGDDLVGLLKHLTLILWFYSLEPEGESVSKQWTKTSPLSATRGL